MSCAHGRVSTVLEKTSRGHVVENGQKNNVMEIINFLNKVWKIHGISLPLIMEQALEVPKILYL